LAPGADLIGRLAAKNPLRRGFFEVVGLARVDHSCCTLVARNLSQPLGTRKMLAIGCEVHASKKPFWWFLLSKWLSLIADGRGIEPSTFGYGCPAEAKTGRLFH
jgi:hypothetical protein